jgi:protein phosphatase
MSLMLQPAVRTDVGRRANNEDAVFATQRLAAVADRVGGAAAGEIASQTVIGALMSLEKSRLAGRLEDALARLTRDDSLIQALIDRGALSETEAHRHPQRSVVLAALDGTPRELRAVATRAARAGDRLLLCSDGLSDVLPDAAIAALLGEERDAQRCAERLVDEALAAGARDNVTVVVADVVARPDPAPLWPPTVP